MMRKELAMAMLGFAMFGLACDRAAMGKDLPVPAVEYKLPTDQGPQSAIFAGGCFWCVEAVFERLQGVQSVVSGYAGDAAENAKYELVSRGATRHAEVVKITFDPSKISYGTLLRVFFATHDPTTLNRQGPDVGTQYRSAVFYQTDAERQMVEAYIKQLTEAKSFERPIVTGLEPIGAGFFPAEAYHQDYVLHNPDNGYVRQQVPPKLKKLETQFSDQLKGAPATQPSK
jgi:peptide-methionine (S)-S-oxide reductase